MTGKIIRIERTPEAVFGVLTLDGAIVCLTLERPDLDNRQNVSCIPTGVYVCRRNDSPKFGESFKFMNVPARSDILLHVGNTVDDSTGCVLLGSEYGELEGKRAVLESGKAFKKFMERMDGVDFFPMQIINL